MWIGEQRLSGHIQNKKREKNCLKSKKMKERGIKRNIYLILKINEDRYITSKFLKEEIDKKMNENVKFSTIKEFLSRAKKNGLIERGVYPRGYRKNKPVKIVKTNYEDWRGI